MLEIIFSGADGSGKTTAARFLYAYLSSRGCSVCMHWVRGSHLFASVILRFLSRFSAFRGSRNPYYNVSIPRGLGPLWAFIEFTSFLPHLLARFLLGRVCLLVCDRGVLDFVVWVSTTLDYPGFLNTLIGRFLLSLTLRENIVYLYADLQTLLSRSDVPKDFLLRELAFYNILSRYYAETRIDTGRNGPSRVAALFVRRIKGVC